MYIYASCLHPEIFLFESLFAYILTKKVPDKPEDLFIKDIKNILKTWELQMENQTLHKM